MVHLLGAAVLRVAAQAHLDQTSVWLNKTVAKIRNLRP